MKPLLLDTHVWIWYVSGNREISKSLRKLIAASIEKNEIHLAAISLWEVSMLEMKKRIILEMPCLEWINQALRFTHANVVPLSSAIAVESCSLPGNFHDDPADRMIAASARIEKLTLVTRDERMLEYGRQKFLSVLKG